MKILYDISIYIFGDSIAFFISFFLDPLDFVSSCATCNVQRSRYLFGNLIINQINDKCLITIFLKYGARKLNGIKCSNIHNSYLTDIFVYIYFVGCWYGER
jgi:hypothetical protein